MASFEKEASIYASGPGIHSCSHPPTNGFLDNRRKKRTCHKFGDFSKYGTENKTIKSWYFKFGKTEKINCNIVNINQKHLT